MGSHPSATPATVLRVKPTTLAIVYSVIDYYVRLHHLVR